MVRAATTTAAVKATTAGPAATASPAMKPTAAATTTAAPSTAAATAKGRLSYECRDHECRYDLIGFHHKLPLCGSCVRV